MSASRFANVSCYKGTDFDLVNTIYQSDGITPQDITGWHVSFNVFLSTGQTDLITKTVGHGIVLTTPAAGVLTVQLTATDLDIDPDLYEFEFRRTDTNNVTVLTSGFLLVRE